MEKVFGLLFVVFAIVAVQAQNEPRKVVVWSGDKICGLVSRSIPQESRPECSTAVTPRGTVSVITHGHISLSAAFLEEDGYIIAAIRIDNRSEAPMDVDTDQWGAAHYARYEDFSKGGKPILAETSIPSRDIVRGIKAGAGMDASADTFMASISKSAETREIRRSDGSRIRQVMIVDDADAQRMAGSRQVSRMEQASAEQVRIRQNAITQKWIGPSDKIRGLVYFRRVKKARLVVFSLGILDTSYVFRLPRNKS